MLLRTQNKNFVSGVPMKMLWISKKTKQGDWLSLFVLSAVGDICFFIFIRLVIDTCYAQYNMHLISSGRNSPCSANLKNLADVTAGTTGDFLFNFKLFFLPTNAWIWEIQQKKIIKLINKKTTKQDFWIWFNIFQRPDWQSNWQSYFWEFFMSLICSIESKQVHIHVFQNSHPTKLEIIWNCAYFIWSAS